MRSGFSLILPHLLSVPLPASQELQRLHRRVARLQLRPQRPLQTMHRRKMVSWSSTARQRNTHTVRSKEMWTVACNSDKKNSVTVAQFLFLKLFIPALLSILDLCFHNMRNPLVSFKHVKKLIPFVCLWLRWAPVIEDRVPEKRFDFLCSHDLLLFRPDFAACWCRLEILCVVIGFHSVPWFCHSSMIAGALCLKWESLRNTNLLWGSASTLLISWGFANEAF